VVAIAICLVGLTVFSGCENKADIVDNCEKDEFFLRLAYDTNFFFPDDFFLEQNLIGSTYYENTVSVYRQEPWIELYTTNKNEARDWSNISNEKSSVNRKIVQENETEKFFEFVRVNVENENDVLLSRVHNSNYFIPYNGFRFWWNLEELIENRIIGTYNGELTLDKVKQFVEYLWVRGIWNFDCTVITSTTSEKSSRFEHRIQSLAITFGSWGIYDRVYVFDNLFSLDKESRVLTLVERRMIREIRGKRR
jgi:hypothetical protein